MPPATKPRARETRSANDNATAADAVRHVLRVAAGKSRATKSGARGEAALEMYHRAAREAGVALLHKIPTPTRRVKTKHGWTCVYTARSTVDFVGLDLRTGRHLAVEVKTCSTKRRFRTAEVEPHQAAYLDAVERAGGFAALAIVWGQDAAVCLVPWAEARCVASMGDAEVRAYQVTVDEYVARVGGTRGALELDGRPAGDVLAISYDVAPLGRAQETR